MGIKGNPCFPGFLSRWQMSQDIVNEVYFLAYSVIMGIAITFVYDFFFIYLPVFFALPPKKRQNPIAFFTSHPNGLKINPRILLIICISFCMRTDINFVMMLVVVAIKSIELQQKLETYQAKELLLQEQIEAEQERASSYLSK